MAGKYGSADAMFLMDGYNLLAAKVKTLALKIRSLVEMTDGLGDGSEANTPVGMQSAQLTQGGALFDTTQNSIHDAMAAKLGTTPQATVRTAVVGIMGNTLGAVAYGLQGVFAVAYEVVLNLGKLTKANAEYVQAGLVERGAIIQPLTVQAADWTTAATPFDHATDLSQYAIPVTAISKANPGVVTTPVPHGLISGQRVMLSGTSLTGPAVNGDVIATVLTSLTFSIGIDTSGSSGAGTGGSFVLCSTVNGGAGYQQVTAFSGAGGTGYVGTLRHSADNITYADLVVFAAVPVASPQNGQRVAVAPNTTVHRYIIHVGDIQDTGSVTVASMFARA